MDRDDAVFLPLVRAAMVAWIADPKNRSDLFAHLVATGLYHQGNDPAPHRIHDALNACANELRAAALFLLDTEVIADLTRSTTHTCLAADQLPAPAGMIVTSQHPAQRGGPDRSVGPRLLDLPVHAISWFTYTNHVRVRYWRTRVSVDARSGFGIEEPFLWPLGDEEHLFGKPLAQLATRPDIGTVWAWMTGTQAHYQSHTSPPEYTEFIHRQAPGCGISACSVTWHPRAAPTSSATERTHAE